MPTALRSVGLLDVLSSTPAEMAVAGTDPQSYLASYAQTYLQEEIRAEALTRNIGQFARFLEVTARQNAQVTNVSAIARDAAVSRQQNMGLFLREP